MYRIACATLALGVLAACAPAQPPDLTDAERAAITDTIRNESAGWKSAAERADANAVMSYYSDASETAIIQRHVLQLAHSWHTSDESEKVAPDPLASEAVSLHPLP